MLLYNGCRFSCDHITLITARFHTVIMSWRLQLSVQLALTVVSLRYVNTRSDILFKQNILYAMDEILENITAQSTLQCASRCSSVDGCVAIEFQEDNTTCVVIKSATRINTPLTNTKQYMKPVSFHFFLLEFSVAPTVWITW